MRYQCILEISTNGSSLRSEAEGWNLVENPALVRQGKPIGLTPPDYNQPHHYDCALRAMADGWRLLAPPSMSEIKGSDDAGNPKTFYSWNWMFERFVE